MTHDAVDAALEAAFREQWGRVVAALIRRTGNWDLAEECAQEAFAQALRRWPRDGVPRQPGAWLTTVAGNLALDRLRRTKRGTELLQDIGRDPLAEHVSELEIDIEKNDETVIEDDRLRLIFTCCHPALPLEGRVALTLRALAGLTTAQIAAAFLVPEATMAKRLVRAKAKIAGAGIPYRVPPAHLLPQRTGGVMAVLYLLFNEGYGASDGEQLIRADLCGEAIRMARLLAGLMPDDAETGGLLALMLFQHSRRAARLDAHGELVTLEEQDRGRWDAAEISEANAALSDALRRGDFGPYQLQAAIAGCHAAAAAPAATDWAQIAGLYDLLLQQLPSPIVRLNRAVAVAMAESLDAGLQLVAELADGGELSGHHLLEATRADLLRRRGDTSGAAVSYRRALELAPTGPEQRYLRRRLESLGSS